MFSASLKRIWFLSFRLKFRVGHDCLIEEDTQISVQFEQQKTVIVGFASNSPITTVVHNLDWLEEISQTAFVAKGEKEIGAARKFRIDLSERDRC
ncbi:hypothetical protein MRB53_005789 [Persea americana]|uniref:Uncharacterized protein n=1 Tax=Persea americana TaxID=3435 RepID=A0ACC2MEH5_PERAE|nr:hypothetical protein MRB53_005789 [Persea americana]